MPIVGVQNFFCAPTLFASTAGGPVTCTAGTWTIAMSGGGAAVAVVMQSNGAATAVINATLFIACGATPPTALQIGLSAGAGTPSQIMSVPAANLTASANLIIPFTMGLAATYATWGGAGVVPYVQINPTAQNVTLGATSFGVFQLLPAA